MVGHNPEDNHYSSYWQWILTKTDIPDSDTFPDMTMGERIRARRTELGLTQLDIANAFSISKTAVTKWESGVTQPSAGKLQRLAALLNTTVDELVHGPALESSPQNNNWQSMLYAVVIEVESYLQELGVNPPPAIRAAMLVDVIDRVRQSGKTDREQIRDLIRNLKRS